jgi:hypothetical protein
MKYILAILLAISFFVSYSLSNKYVSLNSELKQCRRSIAILGNK